MFKILIIDWFHDPIHQIVRAPTLTPVRRIFSPKLKWVMRKINKLLQTIFDALKVMKSSTLTKIFYK